MHPLIARLIAEAPVITDGAWGTQLQARGLAVGTSADLWNLTRPDQVEEVGRAYVESGSRILLTNTFQAHRQALAVVGLADQVADVNRAGVAIARRAAGGRALVFASIGPIGNRLAGRQGSEREWEAVFAEQAHALAAAGADGLVLETMGDLTEARQALTVARRTGRPVVVSMVFDVRTGRPLTLTGDSPEVVAEALTAAGADVIGANCGRGDDSDLAVCRRLRAASDRPVWMKPSAGLPEVRDGRLVYPITPEEFARHAVALRDAGATFLGGCCGTTPAHIRALCRRLYPCPMSSPSP